MYLMIYDTGSPLVEVWAFATRQRAIEELDKLVATFNGIKADPGHFPPLVIAYCRLPDDGGRITVMETEVEE